MIKNEGLLEDTVEYFINKFEAIPEEKWATGEYSKKGKCCALGHCGVKTEKRTGFPILTDEGEVLNELLDYKVPEINDGQDERYKQTTPKERILAALKDVKLDN